MLKENILANSYKAQRDDVDGFLEFFESYLDDLLHNLDEPLISSAKHVVLAGGKRIRPQLCFYCGSRKTANTKDLLKVSAIIELVHVATLVHDDLLDNAPIRRIQLLFIMYLVITVLFCWEMLYSVSPWNLLQTSQPTEFVESYLKQLV